MNDYSFYILGGIALLIAGAIWIWLLKDNARQEKLIAKHSRDIAGIRKKCKKQYGR